MRYRYRLSLYDDDELDQEIVDYLSRSPRKQELMRSLMRAGFALIVKRQEENLAYLSSMTDEDKAFLIDRAFSAPQESKDRFDAASMGVGKGASTPETPIPSNKQQVDPQEATDQSIPKHSVQDEQVSSEGIHQPLESSDSEPDNQSNQGEDTIDFMDILKNIT